jgi:cellulose synthase/poly-beta-1,6-N-acetylglucosamine synthase-like glycosyltransferase
LKKILRALYFFVNSHVFKLKFWEVYLRSSKNRLNYNYKISFIIPTHSNPESLWNRTIPSIIKQVNIEKEIILVVDSQTTNVEEMMARMTRQISKHQGIDIKIMRSSNYEVPKVFFFRDKSNVLDPKWLSAGTIPLLDGINATRNDWVILFAHDDQLPNENSVYEIFEELKSNKKVAIMGVIRQISPNNSQNRLFTNKPLVKDNYGIQGSIFHKNIAKNLYNINDVKILMANDWGGILRLKFAKIDIVFTNKIMAEYFPSSLWQQN